MTNEEFAPIDQKPKKKKKKNTWLYVLLVMMCITLLASIALSGYSLHLYSESQKELEKALQTNNQTMYSQEDLDTLLLAAREEANSEAVKNYREGLRFTAENNNGVIYMLRELYPECLVYFDTNHYVFEDINTDLPLANFTNENLVANQGFMEYHQDGQVKSIKGIDVSKYQGNVDWQKVADSGVEYVMLRLGIRGYETGKLALDDKFDENIQGALDAGLDVGVYFFTQALNEAEAREEAEFVIEALKPYRITYPVAVDVEDLNTDKARSYKQSKESRTDCAIAFMERIKQEGYDTCIYGNLTTFSKLVDNYRLGDYKKWFAFYDTYIYYPYRIDMWQYSDKGHIDGIEGDVDLNITFPVD